MKNVAEIKAAKMSELVAWFNEMNASTPVKRFADRATAERRCIAVLDAQLDMDAAIDRMVIEAQAGVRSVASLVPAAAAQRNPERKEPKQMVAEERAGYKFDRDGCPSCGLKEEQTYATAEDNLKRMFCHCCGIEYNGFTGRIRKDAAPSLSRAAAIAESWKNAAVAQDRATRCAVAVKGPDSFAASYKSVPAAFRALGMPMGQMIAVRMEVKRNGRAVFGGFEFRPML